MTLLLKIHSYYKSFNINNIYGKYIYIIITLTFIHSAKRDGLVMKVLYVNVSPGLSRFIDFLIPLLRHIT